MTPIDLRIKYRFDTGCAPTYGGHTYRGGLTHEYAEWLEGNSRKREAYRRFTGLYGVYYKNYSLQYTKDYKEWLEDRRCIIETILKVIR